jgi:signal transduction histidine kinase
MQAKKAASVAELASGVAHEIKNPLAIMQNYLELLKLADLGSEERGHVHHIDSELQRISEIIGSLVSFSRVKQLPFQPVCLQQVVNEVLMLLGHRFSAKNIRLVKRMQSAALVSGDENKLKQLFMNLVVNSLEAVLDEGLIEIEVSENGSDGTVSASVSDNGHGISDQERDKIFYPFYTTKMTRANIGLGLSICQNIVESHKGIVKFSSIPGRRTTFTVTLPMLLPHPGV